MILKTAAANSGLLRQFLLFEKIFFRIDSNDWYKFITGIFSRIDSRIRIHIHIHSRSCRTDPCGHC